MDFCKFLLDNIEDRGSVIHDKLFEALLFRQYGVFDLLVSYGANVNTQDTMGNSLVHFMVQINRVDENV